MSVRSAPCSMTSGPILGREGSLCTYRVRVAPKHLEKLLETLSRLPHAVNPQIYYRASNSPSTFVEFPGYDSWTDDLTRALASTGFAPESLELERVLTGRRSDPPSA